MRRMSGPAADQALVVSHWSFAVGMILLDEATLLHVAK